MKLSKILIGIFALCSIVSITFASELTLSPASGDMGDGCMIPVQIFVDTNGKTISATDIIMESSMEFIDFVPSAIFPYFLPPVVESNSVHLIGFTVEPSQRVSGKHSIGTAYFQKRGVGDRDGAIHLYFTKAGDTIDSNLSLPGGIDTLEKINDAYYSFDGTSDCSHTVAPIQDGIKDVPLNMVLARISSDTFIKNSYVYLYLLSGLFILIIVGIFYFAVRRTGKKIA